jgi:hypothetical protein
VDNPPPVQPRMTREMRRLEGFYNTAATAYANQVRNQSEETKLEEPEGELITQEMLGVAMVTTKEYENMIDRYSMMIDTMQEEDMAMSAMAMDYDKVDPIKSKDMLKRTQKFNEAWNHPDPWVRKKRREAILKELLKMKQNKVWRIIQRSEMDAGRECIKCKWVFEIKRDETFRARLVACGYSQVPGVDFQESLFAK